MCFCAALRLRISSSWDDSYLGMLRCGAAGGRGLAHQQTVITVTDKHVVLLFYQGAWPGLGWPAGWSAPNIVT
jgi:hypothetical protein